MGIEARITFLYKPTPNLSLISEENLSTLFSTFKDLQMCEDNSFRLVLMKHTY